jgi:hypothetical protein
MAGTSGIIGIDRMQAKMKECNRHQGKRNDTG